MNEQNKSPGQLAYEFLSSLSSNPLFKWSSLDLQWQQSWEQTAAFMAGKTTQAPVPEDKWAREKEHFAKGGRIQFDVGDGTWRDWSPANAPAFPNSWGAWRIHPEDIKPDNCPTCGSSSIAIKMIGDDPVIQGGEHGSCPDAFHTSVAATPAPAPAQKLHVGDTVTYVNGPSSHSIIEDIRVDGGQCCKCSTYGWFSSNLLILKRYGDKHLRALCGGNEPHRVDGWTAEMLPPGTRPLCKGETLQPSDQWKTEGFDEWNGVISETLKPENLVTAFCRTTRPAPPPPQAQNKCPKCGEDWSCHGDSSNTCTYSPAQAEPTAQTEEKTLAQTIAEIIMVDSDEFDGSIHAYLIDGFAMSGKRDYSEQHRLADLACEKIAQAAIAFAKSDAEAFMAEVQRFCKEIGSKFDKPIKSLSDVACFIGYLYGSAQSSRTEEAGKVEIPSVEELCELAHDNYEEAAKKVGWSTNPQSRVPWKDVPERNKACMHSAISAVREACMSAKGGNMLTCPFCHESDFDTEGLSGHLSRYCEKSGTRWQDRENWKQRAQAAEQAIAKLQSADKLNQNEILRLAGLLRVSNTERNDANKTLADLRRENEGLQIKIESLTIEKDGFAKGSDFALKKLTEESERAKQLESDLTAAREELGKMEVLAYETRPKLDPEGGGVTWMSLSTKYLDELYKTRDERDAATSINKAARRQLDKTREALRKAEDTRNTTWAVCEDLKQQLTSLKASSGWIPLSERKPTRVDADDLERVLWRLKGKVCEPAPFDIRRSSSEWFWHPMSPLPTPPPSPEEGERIPLEASDIPPGSYMGHPPYSYFKIEELNNGHVVLPDRSILTLQRAMDNEWLIRRPGEDWQPCSKPARKAKGDQP